jgi:hypothetical protein
MACSSLVDPAPAAHAPLERMPEPEYQGVLRFLYPVDAVRPDDEAVVDSFACRHGAAVVTGEPDREQSAMT